MPLTFNGNNGVSALVAADGHSVEKSSELNSSADGALVEEQYSLAGCFVQALNDIEGNEEPESVRKGPLRLRGQPRTSRGSS